MPEPRRKMSLGLSIANLGYHYAAWRHPRVPAGGNMDFRHFVHCAKLAERGKFDLIFLADSSAVRDLDGSVTSHAVCCDAVGLNYPDHAFCMMPIAMRA